MSYNYLPLDRKWLHFQQVKNLLDFNQQISITFDAHERILESAAFLHSVPGHSDFLSPEDTLQLQERLIHCSSAEAEEASIDVVRLMLMLKVKSLSYGYSGVEIETVKRLMEMYNNAVFPVVYTNDAPGEREGITSFTNLVMSLVGLGQVYYKNEKQTSSHVLQLLGWSPLQLTNKEVEALQSGSQYIGALGLYILKKSEQVLKWATRIAAVSYNAKGLSVKAHHARVYSIRRHKEEAKILFELSKYLKTDEYVNEADTGIEPPAEFSNVPHIHATASETFAYVLDIFLKEVNSVSESISIFPEDGLVVTGSIANNHLLTTALDFLAITMNAVAETSVKRTLHFSENQNGRSSSRHTIQESNGYPPGLSATNLLQENQKLCLPSSIHFTQNKDDALATADLTAAHKTARILSNMEKMLAIELVVSTGLLRSQNKVALSAYTIEILESFTDKVGFTRDDEGWSEKIAQALLYIQSHKL